MAKNVVQWCRLTFFEVGYSEVDLFYIFAPVTIFQLPMACRYYSIYELAQLLGQTADDYHRNTKRLIKKDFKEELSSIGVDNPDIWLDNNIIRLVDPNNSNNFIETGLDINAYI